MRANAFLRDVLLPLLAFVGLALLLFVPSYDRQFASDDYCVLNYLIEEKGFIMPGFFRPVGDLTLKWTHALAGWDASAFYMINAALHGFNAWLLFVLCRRLSVTYAVHFPIFVAGIFLVYHSVGEVVLWTIGRGISLATTFSLLAMITFVSNVKPAMRYVLATLFYFIAISAYESVILLPLVMFVIARQFNLDRPVVPWAICFAAGFTINIVARVSYTGKVWSAYSGKIFPGSLFDYAASFVKTSLRVFMPPVNQPMLFSILAASVILMIVFIVFIPGRKKSIHMLPWFKVGLSGLVAGLLMAMMYGASTRTTEGDRLLYFPAIFFALLIGAMIMSLPANYRKITFIVICIAQIFFLLRTERNWIRADQFASTVRKQISEARHTPLYVVDLPSDYKGAFIFRNCLEQALELNGLRPDRLTVLNKLGIIRDMPEEAPLSITYDSIVLPSQTVLYLNDERVWRIRSVNIDQELVPAIRTDEIMFWNGKQLAPLPGRH